MMAQDKERMPGNAWRCIRVMFRL